MRHKMCTMLLCMHKSTGFYIILCILYIKQILWTLEQPWNVCPILLFAIYSDLIQVGVHVHTLKC